MTTDERTINWQLAQVLYDHSTKEFRLQVPLYKARPEAWPEFMGTIANRPPPKPRAGDDRDVEPYWREVSAGPQGIVVEDVRPPHVAVLQGHLERAVVEADEALETDQATVAERTLAAEALTTRFQQP